jgi:predicted DNA-binding protein
MSKTAMQNMHLPLPEPLYRRLRAEARKAGRPTTELAREAIDVWLIDREREELYRAIQDYASEVAGGRDDLDEDLEVEAIELLNTGSAQREHKR